MSAFHVVVRPRPERAPSSTLAPLYGLFDAVVDGVNVTARIGDGLALPLVIELGHAVASLAAGRRSRCALQLYADDEVWELGLEADGEDALVTVFRSGPLPEVAVFERRVRFTALRDGLLSAMAEAPVGQSARSAAPANAPVGELTPSIRESLGLAARELEQAWPPRFEQVAAREIVALEPARRGALELRMTAELRRSERARGVPASEVEHADLHGLLAKGTLWFKAHRREIRLEPIHVFLVAERLVSLAEDAVEAWVDGRHIFRRVEVSGVRLSVRRGPGDGPLEFAVARPSQKAPASTTRSPAGEVIFPAVCALDLASASAAFVMNLGRALAALDPGHERNLRLASALESARRLADRVAEILSDDSVVNLQPEAYRSFAPRRGLSSSGGKWATGAKMRFLPRWVATVPGIDLRATFLCGDRLVVGAQRECACIDRASGTVVWRVPTAQGGSVASPAGLIRIAPDGTVDLYELETGERRFRTRFSPRAAGGATGAVVHAAGLPKLLVLAEADRRITALDLVTGEVRWRHTTKRPGGYRIRRAGKLLLVTGGESALLALDVATGETVWRIRDRMPFDGAIALDHDAAFALSGAGSNSWKLFHIDPWSGSVRFSVPVDERPVPGQPPLVTADAVVVPTRDRTGVGARAFDRATGELVWEQATGLAAPATAWLAVDDAIIANSGSGVLLCLDARSGSLRYNHVFSRSTGGDQPRRLEPVLRSGALFVPQQEVHVMRPRDGEVIGTVPCDLLPDLLRVDEQCGVYVAEESGHVAAFGAAPRLSLVK